MEILRSVGVHDVILRKRTKLFGCVQLSVNLFISDLGFLKMPFDFKLWCHFE